MNTNSNEPIAAQEEADPRRSKTRGSKLLQNLTAIATERGDSSNSWDDDILVTPRVRVKDTIIKDTLKNAALAPNQGDGFFSSILEKVDHASKLMVEMEQQSSDDSGSKQLTESQRTDDDQHTEVKRQRSTNNQESIYDQNMDYFQELEVFDFDQADTLSALVDNMAVNLASKTIYKMNKMKNNKKKDFLEKKEKIAANFNKKKKILAKHLQSAPFTKFSD